MKTPLLLISFICTLCAFGEEETPLFTRDLTLGSQGQDVSKLQEFLEDNGFLRIPQGVTKGFFGPLTKAGLKAFQLSKGISPASGEFRALTRKLIIEAMQKPKPRPKPSRRRRPPVWGVDYDFVLVPPAQGFLMTKVCNYYIL